MTGRWRKTLPFLSSFTPPFYIPRNPRPRLPLFPCNIPRGAFVGGGLCSRVEATVPSLRVFAFCFSLLYIRKSQVPPRVVSLGKGERGV